MEKKQKKWRNKRYHEGVPTVFFIWHLMYLHVIFLQFQCYEESYFYFLTNISTSFGPIHRYSKLEIFINIRYITSVWPHIRPILVTATSLYVCNKYHCLPLFCVWWRPHAIKTAAIRAKIGLLSMFYRMVNLPSVLSVFLFIIRETLYSFTVI